MVGTEQLRFDSVDAAIIRVAALDSPHTIPPWPDLIGSRPAQVDEWRSWLGQVWENHAIAEAIETSSSTLARRVAEICDGRPRSPQQIRRAVESVLRYLLRAAGRATPFGYFAAVGPARIGSRAGLHWHGRHQVVARPDAAWLAGAITLLEGQAEVLRHLSVTTNSTVFARGDRLVIPHRQRPGSRGEVRLADVTVRNTRAVQSAIRIARSPVNVGELVDRLAADYSASEVAVIERMVTELVARSFLITNLNAAMDVTDVLEHLIDRLRPTTVDASAPHPILDELEMLRSELAGHNRATTPQERRAIRASVAKRMSAICSGAEPSLAVDLRFDGVVTLPWSVAREAEAAAEALVRLTPHPHGTTAWRDYHARFLERYGIGAVVPVQQITNFEVGLGYPAGYRGAAIKPPASLQSRERMLLRMAQRAALRRQREIHLDERDVSEMAAVAGQQPSLHVVPHTELRFSVQAPTVDALDRGDFSLVILSAGRQAGVSAGRFLYLLPDDDRRRMMAALAGIPTAAVDAKLAQVSCPPLALRAQNLTRTPAMLPQISIGEHRPPSNEVIPLEDLAVSGDAHGLFLVSLSEGHKVEAVMVNAMELRQATHPLARFLCEISTSQAAAVVPFSWGAAADLPYLPRIRFRRAVLCPATWNLSSADLPPSQADWSVWERAWNDWRGIYDLPNSVFFGDRDLRLRLDLGEPAHLATLRAHVDRYGAATLTEAPELHQYGWAEGRVHEVVLPLARRPSPWPTQPRRQAPKSAGAIAPTLHSGHMPGSSPWLYARLHAPSEAHISILTDHLPDLVTRWRDGPIDGWWFLRHHGTDPHIRLRFPLHAPGHYGSAAQFLGAWAKQLRSLGLLRTVMLDTYYPEVGRYGMGATMAAAEAVFAADSAVALAQLALSKSSGAHTHAITAASFTDLASGFTGDLQSGWGWLKEHVHRRPATPINRDLYDQAVHLANPSEEWAVLRTVPGGNHLVSAWKRRCAAITDYRARLSGPSPEPDAVLASLLHLHHARMRGIDFDSERLCLRLARAAALSWMTRRGTKETRASRDTAQK
ncbi:lantibiotic dehydratase [Sinosporangium siamense]|uniref:Lantibiotic dehydratase n=1 Tax=Sinosporangium siamense TaxID=1367973 RepID=A0A919RNZ6_9ACTN|nr:lantibiotic dehydratase [Sinosporangium siamense]GII96365.1 hypothetical protein Ssi02_65960 [Sinosporangium siamense]